MCIISFGQINNIVIVIVIVIVIISPKWMCDIIIIKVYIYKYARI